MDGFFLGYGLFGARPTLGFGPGRDGGRPSLPLFVVYTVMVHGGLWCHKRYIPLPVGLIFG